MNNYRHSSSYALPDNLVTKWQQFRSALNGAASNYTGKPVFAISPNYGFDIEEISNFLDKKLLEKTKALRSSGYEGSVTADFDFVLPDLITVTVAWWRDKPQAKTAQKELSA